MLERRSTREPLVAWRGARGSSRGRSLPSRAAARAHGEPGCANGRNANEAYTTHNQMMTQYFNRVRFDELATRTALVHGALMMTGEHRSHRTKK